MGIRISYICLHPEMSHDPSYSVVQMHPQALCSSRSVTPQEDVEHENGIAHLQLPGIQHGDCTTCSLCLRQQAFSEAWLFIPGQHPPQSRQHAVI